MAEIKARPTVYEGIQMRSRLEADYAAHLDGLDFPWEYEPKCFGARDGQWLPDFQTSGGDRLPGNLATYIEIKSAHLFAQQSNERASEAVARIDGYLNKMAVAWSTDPDAFLELIFWKYKAEEPVWEIYAHGGDNFWLILGESLPFPLVWPGMGQAPATLGIYSGFMDGGA